MNGKTISPKFLIGIILAIGVMIIIPSISEFIIALINRYSVYPTGQDTNMLAHMTMLQFLFSAIVAAVMVLNAKTSKNKKLIILPFVVLLFCIISQYIPSFLPHDWCRYELRIYSCDQPALF